MPAQTWNKFITEINHYFFGENLQKKRKAVVLDKDKTSLIYTFFIKYFCDPIIGPEQIRSEQNLPRKNEAELKQKYDKYNQQAKKNAHLKMQRDIFSFEGALAHTIATDIDDGLCFARESLGDDLYFLIGNKNQLDISWLHQYCMDKFLHYFGDNYFYQRNELALYSYLEKRVSWEYANRDKRYSIPYVCCGTKYHHFVLMTEIQGTRTSQFNATSDAKAAQIQLEKTPDVQMPTFREVIGFSIFHPIRWLHALSSIFLLNIAKAICYGLNYFSGKEKNSWYMLCLKGLCAGLFIAAQFVTLFLAKYTTAGGWKELFSDNFEPTPHNAVTKTHNKKPTLDSMQSSQKKVLKTAYQLAHENSPDHTHAKMSGNATPRRMPANSAEPVPLPNLASIATTNTQGNDHPPASPVMAVNRITIPAAPSAVGFFAAASHDIEEKKFEPRQEKPTKFTKQPHRRFTRRSMSLPRLERIAAILATEATDAAPPCSQQCSVPAVAVTIMP